MRLQRAQIRRVVLKKGHKVVSPLTGASLEITDVPTAANDGLSVTRVFKPDMGRFFEHVHLDFDERFEIEEGVAEAKIGGDTLRLTSGKPFYVPRGVAHVNPYNADIKDLKFRQSFHPPTDAARSYIQTLERVLWYGRDDQGELPKAVILAVADVTDEHTYLTGPRWRRGWGEAAFFALQRKGFLPLGRLLAGARGYDVYLTCEPEPQNKNGPRGGQVERAAGEPQRSEAKN